jgi:localization factor PodJL
MSAGVPWSVSAVDPDTWDAAREAARRSGLSVGEWLEAAIRENARGGHARGRNPATNFDHRLDDLAEQINMLARRNVYQRPAPQPQIVRNSGNEQITASIDALTDRIDQMLEGMERAQRNTGSDEISAAIRKLDSRIGSILIERPSSNQDSEVETKLDEMARVISQMSERLEREVAVASSVPQQAPTADELDAAVAEIMERQSALDGTPMRRIPARAAAPLQPQPNPQFATFERQLKTIADEMQSIRKSQAKNAQTNGPIADLRRDIQELAHTMAELAPRRTLESLEHTVEALARKLDRQTQHSRHDQRAAQSVLTALEEIRTAVANVHPQESFISVEGDLNALSEKLDVINAKSIDGTTVARIQNQIQEVRDLLSNALPAENLQAVVAQIETIANKVERAASPEDNGVRDIVGGLEHRIDSLAQRIETGANPGSEALDRIHQRLDSLQAALDRAENPMGLEETMRAVVTRLDASEAKLANLGTIERGISDLSAQFDKARANAMDVAERAAKTALRELRAASQTMPQQVAAAQVEGDRLAAKPLAGDAPPARKVTQVAASTDTQQRFTRTPPVTVRSNDEFVATDGLPADFPLEPGSGAPRSRVTPVQQRIAQSEAAVADIAPRTPDANAKTSDFIAAARRAAQAAAAESVAEEAQGSAKKGALQGIFARSRRAVLLGLVVAMLGFSAVRFFDVNLITSLIGGSETPAPAPSPAPQSQAPVPAPEPANSALPTAMPDVPAEVQQRSMIPGIINPIGNLAPAAGEITPQRMLSLYSHPALDSITTQSTKQTPRTALQSQTAVSPTANSQNGSNELPAGIGNAALRQAALNGDADAAFEIGERYLTGQGVSADTAEAVKWFERAVAKGSPAAAFRLGMAYEKGQGVQKDRARAKTNYVLAAESGHLKAMHNLAVMLVEDSSTAGKQPDYTSAIPWFRKAAERGLRDSQYNLGVLYARGLGLPQNLPESFRWFSLAANQGDVDAAKKRDDVASRLDQQTLVATRLAVQTWTAQPSDESVNAPRAKPEWQNAALAPKKKQKK